MRATMYIEGLIKKFNSNGDYHIGDELSHALDDMIKLEQQLQEKQAGLVKEIEEYSILEKKCLELEIENKKLQAEIEAYQGHDCGYWEDVGLKQQLKERDQLIVEARDLALFKRTKELSWHEWLEKTKDIK